MKGVKTEIQSLGGKRHRETIQGNSETAEKKKQVLEASKEKTTSVFRRAALKQPATVSADKRKPEDNGVPSSNHWRPSE